MTIPIARKYMTFQFINTTKNIGQRSISILNSTYDYRLPFALYLIKFFLDNGYGKYACCHD